ncbi:hypothetical protein SAY86_030219 [Trapa natans]|uniref:X8 domain-containing protein n=1 Tax=Trapa natans TaxID=22666 RepID=A0AAN7LXL0_TRANT|nr:hypothetical protein SAY86_030219 [Trapa natans]
MAVTITRSTCTLRGTLALLLYASVTFSIHCDARGIISRAFSGHLFKRVEAVSVEDVDLLPESSNTDPYVIGSPFTLPPFDSLPPFPLPDTTPSPPFCINPPATPQSPPASATPSPTGFTPAASPPPPPFYYNPPTLPGQISPPPPSSPTITGSPPPYFEPSPNPPVASIPSPPSYYFPTPPSGGGGQSPPAAFHPPVIFPAPTRPPPPPRAAPTTALWCVAKPSVPDPIIQEAMNYACGSGADCASIQPEGQCFQPNTLFAHASYAFNSYWQRTKVAGGSCSFGGIAMLVTVDPSELLPHKTTPYQINPNISSFLC